MAFFTTPGVVVEEVETAEFQVEQNLFPSSLISHLPMLANKGVYLCGGAALALYLGNSFDSINDYDFYVKDRKTQQWFERWLTSELSMTQHFITDNAVTYVKSDRYRVRMKGKVQIIIRQYFFNYYDVFDTFDFSICKIGYDGKEFYFGPNTKQHILEKKLVLEGKPTSDFVKRWFKYSLKGYRMPNVEAAEIIKGLHTVDFDARKETGY